MRAPVGPPLAGRTHFMTNLLTRAPKRSQPGVAIMVRTIYKQLSPEEVHAQGDRVIANCKNAFPRRPSASGGLADALPDILAFTAFPGSSLAEALVQQPAGTPEQGDPPAHRRGGHLPQPGRNAPFGRRPPLGGLAERHDEWVEGRRYLTFTDDLATETPPASNILEAAA